MMYKNSEGKIIAKPLKVVVEGVEIHAPSDATLAKVGIVPYVPPTPEPSDEPPAPPVYRYSKLKLIVAAKSAGKWAAFKAFITSAGYEDEWAACQFLSSDYPQFAAAKEAIIAAGIATADEVEAILAASVDEEVR